MNPTRFPTKVARRQKEAAERNEAYNKLTPEQKLAKLDTVLGPGLGAKKQRNKLAKQVKKG